MANEATIQTSLQIVKGSKQYRSIPSSFRADVSGSGGPTPGAILVSTAGTDVDLTQLTSPGLCRIQNTDAGNYVEVGVWNPDQSEFYPLMRILPGESYVLRLSPQINKEYSGVGTGTTAEHNTLRIKAANQPCVVIVEAFDS